MTTKEPHSVDTALRAWELYAAEKYQELIRLEAAGHVPEVHDLLRLASCETGKTLPLTSGKASGESLFGPLAEAVEAHEREEYA
ncbi:MAG: hypothetical protein HY042_11370, partial [Spirochaetia bacterium]|nr:hypothetical protein [Spirochaetia bacterium]